MEGAVRQGASLQDRPTLEVSMTTVSIFLMTPISFFHRLTDPRQEHLREIKRWRDNDVKGNNEMVYRKETYN